MFSLLGKVRSKVWGGAEIRKSEEERGKEGVLEKRRGWRRRKGSLEAHLQRQSNKSWALSEEHTPPWIRCDPAHMSTPAIFSSAVTQVTSVSLGQLPQSPEETFYYLPWDSRAKGLGLHSYRTSLCLYTKEQRFEHNWFDCYHHLTVWRITGQHFQKTEVITPGC